MCSLDARNWGQPPHPPCDQKLEVCRVPVALLGATGDDARSLSPPGHPPIEKNTCHDGRERRALRSPIGTPRPKWNGHHQPLSCFPRPLRERVGVRGAQQHGVSAMPLASAQAPWLHRPRGKSGGRFAKQLARFACYGVPSANPQASIDRTLPTK